jgi:hypothetical protein
MSTLRDTPDDDAAGTNLPNPKVQRLLVFIVALLGLLIVAGLVAVIGRVLYLSSRSPAQPGVSDSGSETAAQSKRAVAEVPLPLPPGAVVKSTSLFGNRLAVHYEGPEGSAIVVVDLETKAIVARVQIGRDYLGR